TSSWIPTCCSRRKPRVARRHATSSAPSGRWARVATSSIWGTEFHALLHRKRYWLWWTRCIPTAVACTANERRKPGITPLAAHRGYMVVHSLTVLCNIRRGCGRNRVLPSISLKIKRNSLHLLSRDVARVSMRTVYRSVFQEFSPKLSTGWAFNFVKLP